MTKPAANSKRPEKKSAIDAISAVVKDAGFCFLLNYGGLTVSAFSALRGKLRDTQSAVKVVKNAYLAKALERRSRRGREAHRRVPQEERQGVRQGRQPREDRPLRPGRGRPLEAPLQGCHARHAARDVHGPGLQPRPRLRGPAHGRPLRPQGQGRQGRRRSRRSLDTIVQRGRGPCGGCRAACRSGTPRAHRCAGLYVKPERNTHHDERRSH